MEINEITSSAVDVQEAVQPVTGRKKASRKRSIITFTIVTVVNVGLLSLILWRLFTPVSSGATSTTTVGEISSPLIGKQAPDFTLQTLNGSTKTLGLSNFKGKPLMINFWATWCDPCNQEASLLEGSVPGIQSQGVTLLGIDQSDESRTAVNDFFQKYTITYPNVQDDSNGDISVAYGLIGQPETFFVDKNGKIASVWIGPMTAKSIQAELLKIRTN